MNQPTTQGSGLLLIEQQLDTQHNSSGTKMDSAIVYTELPSPLRSLCLRRIIKEPLYLYRYIKYMSEKSPDSVVPPEIADLLAIAFRDHALNNKLTGPGCDNFFKHFKHKYIPLARINFSGLPISEQVLREFLTEYQSQLNEINISQCPTLDRFNLRSLNYLLRNDNELALIIGDSYDDPVESIVPNERIFDDHMKIKKLVVHRIDDVHSQDDFVIELKLSRLLNYNMANTLKYLDLSNSSIGKGPALMHLESLEVLILYNCRMLVSNVISTICQLKKLCVLDLSREVTMEPDYPLFILDENPRALELIVTKLTNLKHLDISGTCYNGCKDRSISVLEERMNRPFEFLGLFHTENGAAYRTCIPAITIAGEATETQILNACEAYMDRPKQLSKALNDLYNLYKTIAPNESFNNVSRALDIVLTILTRHIGDEQVNVFTTAALWCIVKIKVTTRNLNDAKVRRTIAGRLLDVMHYHKKTRNILINGGLILLFLPDVICEHSRVAAISLHMCQDTDSRAQGFGTTLLNNLACQVGGDQKIYIGELNAIETMTKIIKAKIKENTCDEVLETAWSTLWNITDETPANCERFLRCDGFEAFEHCMDKFGDNKEVLRNIMGLLGNVAECAALRAKFMRSRYISRFRRLLFSPIDGIECSYNACGILAHLISEGDAFWDKHMPGEVYRCEVMDAMCAAIRRWPINSRRNINYRSFEPIVRLLDLDIATAAQYWAVFALANLTRMNPSKYCPMLLPFDGLVRLRRLASSCQAESFVSNLARITLYQYDRYEHEQTLAGLEQCESIDLEVIINFRAEPNNSGDGTSDIGEIML